MDEKKIQELKVLEYELNSSKKDAKIYKCGVNNGLFFMVDKQQTLNELRKQLNEAQGKKSVAFSLPEGDKFSNA